MDATSITPSPAGLRALSHPVRLQMLGLLRVEGPATATTLAARLGINTGAASYHLRQLATHGFITEAADRGNARDRWWQASHQSTRTEKNPASPQDRQTLDAYLQSVAVFHTQNLQAAVEELASYSEEWREASTFSDYVVKLSPTTAARVVARLHEVLGEMEEEQGDDAEDFVVQLSAFRRPAVVRSDAAVQS